MARYLIIAVVLAIAVIVYTLVDIATIDKRRVRTLPKAVWALIIVVLPLVGALLWFAFGRAKASSLKNSAAPVHDPRFSGKNLSSEELDDHVRELEERLRELEEETFPGEAPADPPEQSEPGTSEPK